MLTDRRFQVASQYLAGDNGGRRYRPVGARNAARFVVVDAIDARAAFFYGHRGFTPIPDNPNRLVQKMSDIAAALDLGFR